MKTVSECRESYVSRAFGGTGPTLISQHLIQSLHNEVHPPLMESSVSGWELQVSLWRLKAKCKKKEKKRKRIVNQFSLIS